MVTTESTPTRDTLVSAGETAPDFALKDQEGNTIRLSDFRGKIVVLYFYPVSFSGGCTLEACQFRDSYEDFKQAGAEVIGVSSDSVETQDKFASQYKLPFVLLSDPDDKVGKTYGVKRKYVVFKGRATLIIDVNGVVQHSFESINFGAHMARALRVVRELAAKQA